MLAAAANAVTALDNNNGYNSNYNNKTHNNDALVAVNTYFRWPRDPSDQKTGNKCLRVRDHPDVRTDEGRGTGRRLSSSVFSVVPLLLAVGDNEAIRAHRSRH